ncbi:MAG: PAS domain-containing protein [Planctomycetales bacterium]|nr:PAS domain-containing protein [Planctomycetales bacterium]
MSKLKPISLVTEATITLSTLSAVLFAIGFSTSFEFFSSYETPYLLAAVSSVGSLVLLFTTRRFRNLIFTSASVERQLAGLTTLASDSVLDLHAIIDSSAQGKGWNRLVQVVTDKQQDKGIERRLNSSNSQAATEQYARALRSLLEGVAITDRAGRITYANPAWDSLLGIEGSPARGQLFRECLASIGLFNWQECEKELFNGTRPLSVELMRTDMQADGVLQLSRVPLEGRSNEAAGFVWTLKDVTQLALARQSHEQFLASATHELRTPLTNIRAYTESLLDTPDISPAQQREFFNVIQSESARLSRLLNQLLDLQQMDAGSMTLSTDAFDVLRMVKEVEVHILPLVKEHNLKLTCKIAPNLKTIEADKEKVISCLINLLGNAVKYTPSGGEVKLIAEQLDTLIAITVEDTGIGIAEEELPKIFERFYRCHDDRVANIEGNGLGLAFAQEVAKLHHGELKVESQINKGSRFTLKLPLSSIR